MPPTRDEFEMLISGYLDGELPPEDRARLDALVESDPAIRQEFEAMRALVRGTTAAFHANDPSDPVWDDFFNNVYHRIERRVGWLLFCSGSAALALYGAFLYFYDPWAPLLLKALIAVPVVGLAFLFASVLRQRLLARVSDRYSREIHR
jgi:anti-sigma factor RsiW